MIPSQPFIQFVLFEIEALNRQHIPLGVTLLLVSECCREEQGRKRVQTLFIYAQRPNPKHRGKKYKSIISIKYLLWPYCFILAVFLLYFEHRNSVAHCYRVCFQSRRFQDQILESRVEGRNFRACFQTQKGPPGGDRIHKY